MQTMMIRGSLLLGLSALLFAFPASTSAQEIGLGRNCTKPGTPQGTLSADQTSVMAGTRVRLTATGRGGQGEEVEYMWRSDSGKIFGRGASVEFDTAGLAPGTYNVTLVGRGRDCGTFSEVRGISVIACPPDLRLTANNLRVRAGEVISVSAEGLPTALGLTWTASAGRLVESGSTATVDTAGVTASTITVSASAVGIPDCTRDVTVAVEAPPVVLPDILTFPMTGGRLNNANKQVLDDVSLRGSQDVSSKIVITGRSTAAERRGIAQTRAENARTYLVSEKGIDPSRIEIRTEEGTASEGGIQIAIVPPGATY